MKFVLDMPFRHDSDLIQLRPGSKAIFIRDRAFAFTSGLLHVHRRA